MIFATIGTQLPFPRLMAALDALAPSLNEPIVAQIGADPGAYPHLDTHATLAPDTFAARFAEARVIVGHAGIGTVLSARQHGKPAILVPRRHEFGEHRNDHQLATAAALEGREGLYIAWTPEEISALIRRPDLAPATERVSADLAQLRQHVAAWITGDYATRPRD